VNPAQTLGRLALASTLPFGACLPLRAAIGLLLLAQQAAASKVMRERAALHNSSTAVKNNINVLT